MCGWQMPRSLSQEAKEAAAPPPETCMWSLEPPPSACQVEGREVLPVTMLHLRPPRVMWGNGRT